jgi:hypothetical protein
VLGSGNVGIGTSAPASNLHINASVPTLRLGNPSVNAAESGRVQLFEASLGFQMHYDGSLNQLLFKDHSENVRMSLGRSTGDLNATGDISADGNGAIKAAVFGGTCGTSSSITRSFNNVNASAITISNGAAGGDCTLNIPFDMSNRYVVGAAGFGPGNDRGLSVTISGNTVQVFRFTSNTGTGNSGTFFVLIY